MEIGEHSAALRIALGSLRSGYSHNPEKGNLELSGDGIKRRLLHSVYWHKHLQASVHPLK